MCTAFSLEVTYKPHIKLGIKRRIHNFVDIQDDGTKLIDNN